jgi:hypothetical protein
MASTADVKRILELTATGISALEEIVRVGRGVLLANSTTDSVVGVLEAIVAVAETVIGGLNDSTVVTPEMVQSALLELQGTLAATDRAVDASVDAKFPR